ncbi:hypothetical protein N0V83_009661 [Neocucurbitaria cava]|uniref:O-methyltransferase n=1 Tax=Neocucurbitaria cava TaxID=798079 RepID=A0A9W8Y0N5_9PLEO|nr:hypothetical protein N0V83_009661 [Neocucurbitaria cava]
MAELTKQLSELASKGPAGLEEADRIALLHASYKLSDALENPIEKFIRLFFTIYDPIVLRLCVDLDLVDIALAHGGPISLSEFAEKSKTDPDLLQRILRVLVPLGIFTEPSAGTYGTTPFAPVFASPSPFKSTITHISHLYHSVASMPEYFAQNGYQNPKDAYDAPFQLAHNCKGETYFDYIARPGNERLSKAFNVTMEMQKTKAEESFVPVYPAEERLKNDDPERVLLVDVGGGVGHQVSRFKERYPQLPGKLVLEDLPQVVDTAVDLPKSITKIGHDFFKPQPDYVEGAKAFFLRMILHDWPEKQARLILSNIVDIMADDSVVLIHEVLLPETGVSHFEAKMDWHMLNMGACERTEKQWAALADSVGLEIKAIWMEGTEGAALGSRGMIELGKRA